ncbi:aminotransferase class I/II-fold pyridoxal phosphate-dependent enzyme [Streptomyces sp. NPDC001922]|uniref:aminotransferase class I/II-fold pyridoxal phosphate-dependent enzyme n=1 Tax=Streptomyces sp. NPDC001922 TaxID=3364624 RepID=UPI00369C39C3
MQPTASEGRGPASFGPPAPAPGLPVLPELAERLFRCATGAGPEPVGGSRDLLEAACGYWSRRGLETDTYHVAAGPGAQPLLLALLAAIGGDVLLTRPCAAWYAAPAVLLGRPAYHAPTPAECGGVPDPFALLETVRRVRAEGGDPRVLLLSVADDPCGTVPPPEVLHEVCEAALGEGMLIVSDETYRDTLHEPGTVLFSPAEMHPNDVVVLTDLGAAHVPPGWPAAVVRFPNTWRGGELHAATLDIMAGLRTVLAGPVAAAVAHALTEPQPVAARTAAAARLHGTLAAAVHRTVTAAGALCRPPQAGSHVYVDLDPLRHALEARGISDSVDLENHLSERLGEPVPGGHRFGDGPDALRARLSTGPLLGGSDSERLRTLTAEDPLLLQHVDRALALLRDTLVELDDDQRADA